MLMLLLAIACSVVISVIMRLSGRYVRHRMAMFAVNYAARLVLSRLFVGGAPLLSAQRGLGAAAALGAVSGLLYLASFMLLQRNIRESGMVLSSASMKLGGVLVPVTLDRFDVDPAVASSVFVTTCTDSLGFFTFLGLAALWGLGG